MKTEESTRKNKKIHIFRKQPFGGSEKCGSFLSRGGNANLFYPLESNPRSVVQHIDNTALFKPIFLDQMLHDFIILMRIDA